MSAHLKPAFCNWQQKALLSSCSKWALNFAVPIQYTTIGLSAENPEWALVHFANTFPMPLVAKAQKERRSQQSTLPTTRHHPWKRPSPFYSVFHPTEEATGFLGLTSTTP